MLDLKIKLENKFSYTNFGNYFSKSLIIANQKQKILIITENEKYIDLYEKIFAFLGVNLFRVKNNFDLTELFLNSGNHIFAVNIDEFEQIYFEKNYFTINIDENFGLNKFIDNLVKFGFTFSEYGNSGTYNKKGDLVNFKSFDGKKEFMVSFFGNTIEEITEKQILNENNFEQKKLKFLNIGNSEKINLQKDSNFIEFLNENEIFCVIDLLDYHSSYEKITKNLNNFSSFDYLGQRNNSKKLGITNLEIDKIEKFKELFSAKNVNIFTKNDNLIKNFIENNSLPLPNIYKINENVLKSFVSQNLTVICDDIISKIFVKRRIKKSFSGDIDLLLKINSGDYIVHIDHGIGIFKGIVTKEIGNIKKEYIEIEYKGNDKLFVPISEVRRVSKYVGEDNPALTGLNSKEWERKIKKANVDAERIARELLETQAKRMANKGYKFEIQKDKIVDFQNDFGFIYTESQLNAIKDILNDMNSEKNMDRLLVGDVGFGKTEVAFNAIYTAFLNKKQSCLITPLVVLAYEHLEKAKSRFVKFGLNIEILTRLESKKQEKIVLEKLQNGEIDLVIGTHKLFSENLKFKNLGLIVIDEEHKFGVEHKEKLKKFKIRVDTLSMSATPIPRSLNLSLSGIKDISIISEPPIGRIEIKTSVLQFNENVILDGYKAEIARGGQIFFIHNRIETIENIKNILTKFIPSEKIVIIHGRLDGDELENRIIDFKNKKYDVLLSTTVIENGIDFPNVNTIFINNADNFGLSQIHQLRGRVGRSSRQAFCYMLYKKTNLSKDAAKRLKTIVEHSYLGSGFELAMKDLEIRGGGDILGIRQSGLDKSISINLFLEMLENKISELKNENHNFIDTVVDLNVESYVNDDYFNSDTDKIIFYKEIEEIDSIEDLEIIKEDFLKFNGSLSKSEQNLFDIIKLRILASNYKIINIKRVGINYQLTFDPRITVDDLKKFLELDKKVDFVVLDLYKLRILVKKFENDEKFVKYMLDLFEGTFKKIRLIHKK